jgi:hypothetical protein
MLMPLEHRLGFHQLGRLFVTCPPKGSLGSPDVYKEEQEEHEHMHKGKHHD